MFELFRSLSKYIQSKSDLDSEGKSLVFPLIFDIQCIGLINILLSCKLSSSRFLRNSYFVARIRSVPSCLVKPAGSCSDFLLPEFPSQLRPEVNRVLKPRRDFLHRLVHIFIIH